MKCFLIKSLWAIWPSGLATFEYTKEWQQDGFSLSPLYLPLNNTTFTFPSLSWETYHGLPAVFADSLPDDFGNALINAWLARQGMDKSQFKAIDRLLYTGTRGMGALEYQPTNGSQESRSEPILIGELVGMTQKILDSRNGLQFRQLELSYRDQEQIYRRMVFNVVARNHDDHTKNWSFMVDDDYKWTLAPAFDVAWSYKEDSSWVHAHQLSLAGKREKFQLEDLLSVTQHISGLRRNKAKQIIEETIGVVSGWRELADAEGVPAVLRESVWNSLRIKL
ncbi:type II toxin-antitoxin system HipA family toxin [Xenorhabdus nematophila]|uniref:type II toxin-antitoxin system HipA family toxin n=1 Tax=Xenorhabdus nematophila TaxID=628 RepID=UPI0002E80B55|nr:HipA domain-containing protein [Xenorhabdus nematophila]CEK24757.1 hypothetical protein XNC2_3766 [Xenorhabdus nematophila AN6/1]